MYIWLYVMYIDFFDISWNDGIQNLNLVSNHETII